MARGSEGVVVEEKGEDRVIVQVIRGGTGTCTVCGAKDGQACGLSGGGETGSGTFGFFHRDDTLRVEAVNQSGAKIGDVCKLHLKDDRLLLKGSFILYMVPGILFILGLVFGGIIGESAFGFTGDSKVLAQLVGGVILLALGLGFGSLYSRVRADDVMPIVSEVIRSAEQDQYQLQFLSQSEDQPSTIS